MRVPVMMALGATLALTTFLACAEPGGGDAPDSEADTAAAGVGARSGAAAAPRPEDEAARAEVGSLVEEIFVGMREADSAAVRALFDPGARFAMVTDSATVRYAPVDGWIQALGESAGRWDERIYDMRVRVDSPIASAWAPYTFYLDGAISHCGVNTIEMLHTRDGWRITQLSDSRYTEDCPDPLGAAGQDEDPEA
ncbi:MAG TPA: nuclear transport factor 2 family protein [Longimicrobiales bacterium]|nr:nuclear transport factor 2 family protein [Longimicrobiales bacterium]